MKDINVPRKKYFIKFFYNLFLKFLRRQVSVVFFLNLETDAECLWWEVQMDLSEILKPDKNKDLLRKLIITTLKNDYNINDININYNNIKNCNINYNNYKKKN